MDRAIKEKHIMDSLRNFKVLLDRAEAQCNQISFKPYYSKRLGTMYGISLLKQFGNSTYARSVTESENLESIYGASSEGGIECYTRSVYDPKDPVYGQDG